MISIFKEDNVFSMTANLPYGPPVNTDIHYYRTFSDLLNVFVIAAKLVVQYLLGEVLHTKLSLAVAHQVIL